MTTPPTSPLQGNAGRAFRFDSSALDPACLSGNVRAHCYVTQRSHIPPQVQKGVS